MNNVICTYPFVEFFAYLGVQTYSWEKEKKERKYRYHVWTIPLSITVPERLQQDHYIQIIQDVLSLTQKKRVKRKY